MSLVMIDVLLGLEGKGLVQSPAHPRGLTSEALHQPRRGVAVRLGGGFWGEERHFTQTFIFFTGLSGIRSTVHTRRTEGTFTCSPTRFSPHTGTLCRTACCSEHITARPSQCSHKPSTSAPFPAATPCSFFWLGKRHGKRCNLAKTQAHSRGSLPVSCQCTRA